MGGAHGMMARAGEKIFMLWPTLISPALMSTWPKLFMLITDWRAVAPTGTDGS